MIDQAAEQKQRLEDKQRAKRKDLEKRGIEYKPLWFHEEADAKGHKEYIFNGTYFDNREKGDWSKCPDLF